MNNNNLLNLREGSWGVVLELAMKKGNKNMRVFVPTTKAFCDGNGMSARVLDVNEDGSISVHWASNFNTSGDFRSELMQFSVDLIMDNLDFDARNKVRVANGLVPMRA